MGQFFLGKELDKPQRGTAGHGGAQRDTAWHGGAQRGTAGHSGARGTAGHSGKQGGHSGMKADRSSIEAAPNRISNGGEKFGRLDNRGKLLRRSGKSLSFKPAIFSLRDALA